MPGAPTRPTGRKPFLLAALATTVVLGVLLLLQVPLPQRQKSWLYQLQDKHMLGTGVLVAIAFALPLVARMVSLVSASEHPRAIARKAVALVLFGVALQHGLALSENRGWRGMRDHIVYSGHSTFAEVAAKYRDLGMVLRDYDRIAADQKYLPSKPPGQLLFYMLTGLAADAVVPDAWSKSAPGLMTDRQWRLTNLALFAWPLLSMLTLLPLTYLAVALLPRELSLWPAFLYLLAPPTQLITLHLDQVLYPLLTTTMWVLAVLGVRDRRRPWLGWAAAGVTAWVGLFVSFSVLPALPLTAAFAWAAASRTGHERPLGLLLRGAIWAALPFVALTALAWASVGYNPVHTFQTCMAYHHKWKSWTNDMRWPAARLDLIEYTYWLGPAIVFAFGWQVVIALRGLRAWRSWDGVVPAATFAVLMITDIFGSTVAEVPRLWMFLVPAVVFAAGPRIGSLAEAGRGPRLAVAMATTQFAWMFCLKAMEDFG